MGDVIRKLEEIISAIAGLYDGDIIPLVAIALPDMDATDLCFDLTDELNDGTFVGAPVVVKRGEPFQLNGIKFIIEGIAPTMAKPIITEPPRFPPYPVGYILNNTQPRASAMTPREYYAAHCPMTMKEAYDIWAGNAPFPNIPGSEGHREGLMSLGLREGKERISFFEWWALMRFEYADAMVKEGASK